MIDDKPFEKYRKMPVVIEAYQTDEEMEIKTLEGTMKANKGDWIIKGVKGELYPCKPDVFELTYEKVEMGDLVKKYNAIYDELGFDGIIEEMEHTLVYGSVTELYNDMYCISTGGWSDDEERLHNLICFASMFGHIHYVGVLCGGHFYFSRNKRFRDFEIVDVTSEDSE